VVGVAVGVAVGVVVSDLTPPGVPLLDDGTVDVDALAWSMISDDAPWVALRAKVQAAGHVFPPADRGTITCTACGVVVTVETALLATRPCPGKGTT